MTFKKRIFAHAILALLLIGSIPLFIGGISQNARAVPTLAFLSDPILEADLNQMYDYEIITNNYSAEIEVWWTDATWASFYLTSWHLRGFPNETDIGLAHFILRMWNATEVAWQNFTVIVQPVDYNAKYLELGMGFIFCFGLLFVGFKRNEFMIMAGPIWIIVALTVFIDYGDVFLLAGIGIGIVLFLTGVLKIAG